MGALLILSYDVQDPDLLRGYRRRAVPILVERYGGTVVAATDVAVQLQEAPTAGEQTVIVTFPTLEQAQAAYSSPEYQEVLADRLSATTSRVAFIVPMLDVAKLP